VSAASGLETLQEIKGRGGVSTGVASLLGLEMGELEEGRVTFRLGARAELGNPLGSLHGGIISTLLDSAMGCAVHSALPAGAGYTTIDLNVTFLRSVPLDGGDLRAEGRVIHLGRRMATAAGEVVDGGGRLVATATTTCMVFRP